MKRVEESDYNKMLDFLFRIESMGHNNSFVRKMFHELEGKKEDLLKPRKWSEYMSERIDIVHEYMLKDYSVQGILTVVRDNLSDSDRLLLSEGILDIIKETKDGKVSEITSKF
jgi:hypothetical protein